jgi:hypothetical protein
MPQGYDSARPGLAQFLRIQLVSDHESKRRLEQPGYVFQGGQLIAIFKRSETLFDQIGPESHHVLSESLVSSQDFTSNGETMNFR